ncbi:MAG: tail fiber domain-containing protein [Verrucomicrobiota bacterium]
MKRIVLFSVGAIGLLCSTLHAQVPQLMAYQGRIVVGTTNFNGTGQFKFALVNTDGSTTYWSNDGTSNGGSEPANAVSINVSNGLYSVLLGDTTLANMTTIPYIAFANSDVRLRIWFNDGTRGSQLLSPDQRIASVGYAVLSYAAGDPSTGATVTAGGDQPDQLNISGPGGIKLKTETNNSILVTTGHDSLGDSALFIDGDIVANGMTVGGVTAFGDNLTVTSTLTAAGITAGGFILQGTNFQIFPDGSLQGRSAHFLDVGVLSLTTPNATVTTRLDSGAAFFSDKINGTDAEFSGNVRAMSFITTSDRSAKEGFRLVNDREILSHLAHVPIQTWTFKQDDSGAQHIGPMAQDFYAAFQVGPDDKHIATVDADGVAFAAIQGLNEIMQEQNAELKAKAKEIEALEKRLDEIEKTLKRAPSDKVK